MPSADFTTVPLSSQLNMSKIDRLAALVGKRAAARPVTPTGGTAGPLNIAASVTQFTGAQAKGVSACMVRSPRHDQMEQFALDGT